MGLLREQCAEWKKAPLEYCCNQVWMKNGGQIPWNVVLSAKHSRSLVWWETPYERRFGEPCNGPTVPIGSFVEYYPISAKDQSRIHQFGKKVSPGLFLGFALYAERIWKGDVLVADLEELETMDVSEIYPKRLNSKEGCKGSSLRTIHISSRRWTNQTSWRRSGSENIHRDTGPPNSRRRSKVFSWRIISGCRWSKNWFLVHVRKLHIPPSRWTKSQTFTRREKNHSLFHWNTLTSPELLIRIWMSSKRNASMIIGISMNLESCQTLGQVSHNNYSIGWKSSWRIYVVRWEINEKNSVYSFQWETSRRIYMVRGEETEKTASDIQTRSFMARTLERNVKER